MSEYERYKQDLLSMSRFELGRLKDTIEGEIKKRVTITIRETYRRCGKVNCSVCCRDCERGPCTDCAHGPYLLATWSENKTPHQKSLGRAYPQGHFVQMDKERPNEYDYRLNDREEKRRKGKLRDSDQFESYELTRRQFASHYGVYPHEDRFHRPSVIWYNYKHFRTDYERWHDAQRVLLSPFRRWGVGTLPAVMFLEQMAARGASFKR